MSGVPAIIFGIGIGSLLFVSPVSVTPGWTDVITFDRLEAFYVENTTGKLSGDIMPPAKRIEFWNTIIGDGGATGGGGYDVLLVAHFKRTKQKGAEPDISIVVRNKQNKKVILKRSAIFVPFDTHAAEGTTAEGAKAFFLEDVTCVPLAISIRVEKVSTVKELPFDCGE